MKINQYETTDNLQNLKFLGANDSQTIGVPFETVKEQMFRNANATPKKDGLMSKEDKIKLNELGNVAVIGVKGNTEANYRTGNVNITPANVGAVSKAGDTVAGHLHMGNGTMTNSPNIYWDDKNRSVWAGTMNGEGAFYIWDATNNKGIIISNPGGGDNRFLGTADVAARVTNDYKNMAFHWNEQSGQPTWLWGSNDGENMYVWNPSNFSVANANTCAGLSPTSETSGSTIMSRDWSGDTSVHYLNCLYLHSSQVAENGNVAYVIYQNGDGYYRTCSLSHLFNSLGIGNYLPLDGGTMTGTLAVYQYGVTSSFHNAADALCIDARDIQYVKIFCREQVLMQHGPDQGWAWAGCSAGGFFTQSSERYKDNVSDMPDDMAKKILDVNIVTFDYKKNVRIESERYGHSGVLAEQIEPIIPEVVLYQEIDGEKVADSVDYSRFVPYLIKMVQVQQNEIDKLKTQIEKLEGNSIFTNKTITPEKR